MMTGGCACGAVRYRITGPLYDARWCHCRLCQQTSGAPALVFATTKAANLSFEQGEDLLAERRTTSFGTRRHCPRCGTLLTIHVDFQPDEIDIAAMTLDDPEEIRPGFHIFCDEAVSWGTIDDGLPRYGRFRPDTRGLAPGQTVP